MSGLVSNKRCYEGVHALLDNGYQPRQLQVLVDALPAAPGLTVIEAPTGSGKTETALAYAWKLIDQQLADSVIFALPTQATANAMLSRMEANASRLFTSQILFLLMVIHVLTTFFNQ
ncbi:DEAD/DEAH box helicase family protein [Escherichia coli]|nr:DEAD/DEAH box helicase family protein [Escherichia coli]